MTMRFAKCQCCGKVLDNVKCYHDTDISRIESKVRCLDCCSGEQVQDLQNEIAAWADSVYPHRTNDSILRKLDEEVKELHADLLDPHEYADLIILILDLGRMNGINIGKAVREKIEINNKRQWQIDPETGVMSHSEREFTYMEEAYNLGRLDSCHGKTKMNVYPTNTEAWHAYERGYLFAVASDSEGGHAD